MLPLETALHACCSDRDRRRNHDVDPVVVHPMLDVVPVEADEVADLDNRNAPFGHKTTHVAEARPQSERNLVHSQQRRRRPQLAALCTAEGTLGRTRRSAGEGSAFGPALAVGRPSAPSLPFDAGGGVVTFGAHRNPLSA